MRCVVFFAISKSHTADGGFESVGAIRRSETLKKILLELLLRQEGQTPVNRLPPLTILVISDKQKNKQNKMLIQIPIQTHNQEDLMKNRIVKSTNLVLLIILNVKVTK